MIMFNCDVPAFTFKLVRQNVASQLHGTVMKGLDVNTSEYLARLDVVSPTIRNKVDGFHQLIGRWVHQLLTFSVNVEKKQ